MSTYTDKYALRDFTGLAHALADPSRVRALNALRDNELCVCQLVELLGLASSSVSRHLSILARAYLVDSEKRGRWVYYRRAGDDAPPEVRGALRWLDQSLPEDPEDAVRLAEILACPVDQLCRPTTREN